uniref:ABC transporter domain-containing protein n=2 Tax=Emiliania huxleyi TaxID=2903 RepID=A0A7S3WYY8_EMIHU
MLFDVPVHELTAGDGDKALLTADGGRNRGHGADFGHLKNRLRLRSGGRYAMIGRNGCGKSTLLRALASGTLPEWPGSIRTFLVEQDHRIDPEQQVIEAVLSADSRVSDLQAEAARLERESAEARESATERLCEIYEALEELDAESEGLRRHRVEAILGGLGFTAEMQGAAVGELSGGWQARLAMASALFVEPELLLLDEPTNHLDLRGLRWLQRYLRDEFRGTMLVVAHDRAFLDAVATDIILFEGVKGTLTYFHGTLEEFETRTADSSAAMQRQVAALERKKKHIEQSVDKMKQAAAGKHGDQKKSDLVASREKKLGRMGLEKTADGKKFNAQKHGIRAGAANHNDGESKGSGTMRKMVGTSLLPKSAPELKWGFGDSAPLGLSDDAPLLELRSVGFAYPGGGQPTLFSGVELSLGSRCRVALVGRNGTGKSSLMRLLTGEAEPSAGEVWRHRGLRVAHYSQHLAESLDKEETRSGFAWLKDELPDAKDEDLRRQLGSFGINSGASGLASLPLSALSGGQRVRVVIARLAMEAPHLLLLDEPTNHLDLYSIDALSDALERFAGGIVLVSHNASLLEKVARDVYIVSGAKRTVQRFDGTVDEYLARVLGR